MKKSDPPIIIIKTFPTSIDKVWAAITNLPQMQQWYFDNLPSFEPRVGFETQFSIENEGRTFTHLWKVTEVIPMKKISYNWNYLEYDGDGYVTFELSTVEAGTQLRLTNVITKDYPSDIPEFKRESGIGGWEYLLGTNLTAYLLSSDD